MTISQTICDFTTLAIEAGGWMGDGPDLSTKQDQRYDRRRGNGCVPSAFRQ